MAFGETRIIATGNLVADPVVRFTPGGVPVAEFRIACTERHRNRETNTWEDYPTLFFTVMAWREVAENVSETLKKGMSVTVMGSLRERTYTNRDQVDVTVKEIHDPEIGVNLQWQTAQVTRKSRSNAGQGQAPQQQAPQQQAPQQQAPRSAPTQQQVPQGTGRGYPSGPGLLDEPPF